MSGQIQQEIKLSDYRSTRSCYHVISQDSLEEEWARPSWAGSKMNDMVIVAKNESTSIIQATEARAL